MRELCASPIVPDLESRTKQTATAGKYLLFGQQKSPAPTTAKSPL
jgi:hypothetical protein